MLVLGASTDSLTSRLTHHLTSNVQVLEHAHNMLSKKGSSGEWQFTIEEVAAISRWSIAEAWRRLGNFAADAAANQLMVGTTEGVTALN